MAGNGRGQMRAHVGNRSQSFIFIGLLVVIVILCFNYWNVSSKNGLLTKEITDLTDKIRQTAIRKISVEKRNEGLMQQHRECMDASNRANDDNKRKDSDITSLRSQLSEKENILNMNGVEIEDLKKQMVHKL